MNFQALKRLKDLDAAGKRVLVRADLDVPLDKGEVADDTRIRALMPTVEYLLEREARVLLMGHLGEPSGKVVSERSMEPVARRLAELLPNGEVFLTDACVGDGAKRVALDLRDGEVGVLENLAFHNGEPAGDEKLGRELASFAEIYVNESPRTLNHAWASVVGVPRFTAHRACGLMMEKELNALAHFAGKIDRPFVAVLGGMDFTGKLPLVKAMLERAETLVLGGVLGNTFAAASGQLLGRSPVEKSRFPLARDLMARAKSNGVRLLLPTDFAVENEDGNDRAEVSAAEVPADATVRDIGPASRAAFKEVVSRAGTILWNGPMGAWERELFSEGTRSLARAIAGSSAYSMVAGDDSAAAVLKFGLEKGFNHVSSGGSASLEFLEGKVLPGIGALESSSK